MYCTKLIKHWAASMSKSTHLQIGKLDIPRPKSSNDETMSTIKIMPKIHFSQI